MSEAVVQPPVLRWAQRRGGHSLALGGIRRGNALGRDRSDAHDTGPPVEGVRGEDVLPLVARPCNDNYPAAQRVGDSPLDIARTRFGNANYLCAVVDGVVYQSRVSRHIGAVRAPAIIPACVPSLRYRCAVCQNRCLGCYPIRRRDEN